MGARDAWIVSMSSVLYAETSIVDTSWACAAAMSRSMAYLCRDMYVGMSVDVCVDMPTAF